LVDTDIGGPHRTPINYPLPPDFIWHTPVNTAFSPYIRTRPGSVLDNISPSQFNTLKQIIIHTLRDARNLAISEGFHAHGKLRKHTRSKSHHKKSRRHSRKSKRRYKK